MKISRYFSHYPIISEKIQKKSLLPLVSLHGKKEQNSSRNKKKAQQRTIPCQALIYYEKPLCGNDQLTANCFVTAHQAV